MSRPWSRAAVLGTAAALLAVPALAGPAAATDPPPAPGYAPGADLASSTGLDLFYRRTDGRLQFKPIESTDGSAADLGGAIATAPAAASADLGQYRRSWVYAAAANGAVYSRERTIAPNAPWTAWKSLGGNTTAAPAASCRVSGSTSVPVIFVRGGDGALWRRTPSTAWTRLGGSLASAPATVSSNRGTDCPDADDVVAIGGDGAVWELRGGSWSRIGGRSAYAPAILTDDTDTSYLYVIGTDKALWVASRNGDGAAWSGFHRAGGTFTSAPAAQLRGFDESDLESVVFALGGNGQLYLARTYDPDGAWSFDPVP